MIRTKDLYPEIITRQIDDGADELCVVTGYASPEMCARLLEETKNSKTAITIIVGMVSVDGISLSTHERFVQMVSVARSVGRSIDVRYVKHPFSVHTKLYVWLKRGRPCSAWVGSANFTQNGFGVGHRRGHHQELMLEADPDEAIGYYRSLLPESMSIDGSLKEEEFGLFIRNQQRAQVDVVNLRIDGSDELVVLPLVMLGASGDRSRGDIHSSGAGLNWGMRGNRNRNEAYIPVPKAVQRLNFFPARGRVFSVTTAEGAELVMSRAQDSGKALHTPVRNAILGAYFRDRLGVAPSDSVTLADLRRFGSRFVAFKRLGDENDEPRYLMEYSPRVEKWGATFYEV